MRLETEILRCCWFLAGPTACGKSAVALELARRIPAEIIALDSMSLYRGMDIGTAKPSAEDRNRVRHHLIDVLDPHEEFSLAEYVQAAEKSCREILARGRVPLFVGGTGLYLRGILRGVFEGPEADWEFRKKMEAQAERREPGYLHQRLKEVDPESASRLHPNDTRRLVRALEVYHLTGRPLSEQHHQAPLPPEERPPHAYWLAPPRDWLYERINRRVEWMVGEGLIEEVRVLLAGDRPLSRTARQALGYKETIEYLEGKRSLDETVELIQRRTRQFAKRQHTWFRNLVECKPIEMTGEESVEELAGTILKFGGGRE